MKVYILYNWCHSKNLESLRKMLDIHNVHYVEGHPDTIIESNCDYILCIDTYIPLSRFPPNCRVIYGPHMFVLPVDKTHPLWHNNHSDRFVYNTLSPWNKALHENVCPNIKYVCSPFGIDIESLTPVLPENQSNIVIYYKDRKSSDLEFVKNTLLVKNLNFQTVVYGHYVDSDFKQLLSSAKFVIWVGRHESQGFAFQETLAKNVPILVWEVNNMCDEYRNDIAVYNNVSVYGKASTSSYWSEECGIRFWDKSELEGLVEKMLITYMEFTPREFINRELSLNAAFKNMFNIVKDS
jgi:hypothetical protein